MKTSYSALDTFKTCRLKYKFQEIDKIKAPKSKEAVFGTIIHNTFKFLHTSRPISPTIEEALEYFNSLWNSEVYQDKQEETAVLSEGVRIIQNYCAKNNLKNFNVVDLETRFSIDIGNDITLGGVIDRIDRLDDDSFEIIDYKTSRSLPSQKDVDGNFQLSVYYMALLDRWPKMEKPIKLSLYYLKHNIKLSTTRTSRQINETKQYIFDTISEIEKGNFAPTPSALCDWCGYQQYCPMFKHKFKKDKTAEDIDIQAILKEYHQLKSEDKKNSRRIAELQEIINDYCDNQRLERVFGDGIFITRSLRQVFEYDSDKVKSVLEPLGKWNEVISIDSVKLKKVISELSYKERKEIEKARELKKEFKSLSLKEEKKK